MSDTDTDPRQLVVVNARTGTATHLLDRRYAATGQALCGTSVPVGNRPTHDHVSCTTCRSVEKGNPRPSRRPPPAAPQGAPRHLLGRAPRGRAGRPLRQRPAADRDVLDVRLDRQWQGGVTR